jgi:hypothetical protein
MTSTLKVDNIAHSGGTTGMTINSGGQVDLPQNNNISMFALQANQTVTGGASSTLTNWGQMNSQTHYGYKQVGSVMNVSSGSFTTSKLGLYRVYCEAHFSCSNDSRWIQVDLKFTPNGGSTVGGDLYDNVHISESSSTYLVSNRMRYYNFNHTGDQCYMYVGSSASITLKGSTNDFDTMICFEWIAPAVA